MNFHSKKPNDHANKKPQLTSTFHSKRLKAIILSISILSISSISLYTYTAVQAKKIETRPTKPTQSTQAPQTQAPAVNKPSPEIQETQSTQVATDEPQVDETIKQATEEAKKLMSSTNPKEIAWRDKLIQDCKDSNITFEEGLKRINSGEGIQVTKAVQIEQKQDDDINYARQIASKYNSNTEIMGYIKIDALGLREPILCHQNDDNVYPDNDYYLSHDINFKESNRGQINTSRYLPLNLNNLNNIIYGHNMADGTMFGSLKKLLNQDIQSKQNSDIITMFDQQKKINYQILSISIKDPSEDFYFNTSYDTFSNEEKSALINHLRSGNLIEKYNSTPATYNDQFITLSTCYGPAPSTKRLVVFAKKLGVVYTEKY